MKKANVVKMILAASAVCSVGVALAFTEPAAVGHVLSANGGVLIQRDVQTSVASEGSVVGVGNIIVTTDTGNTQWQMSDDSLFAMAPDSGLKINQYELPSPGNAAGVASYTLLKGTVHTITGRIGKNVAGSSVHNTYVSATGRFNPANLIKVVAAPTGAYTLKTATAVITTKGADFTAQQADKVFKLAVTSGSVSVCTVAGCETAGPGEGVAVTCEGCKPAATPISVLGFNAGTLSFNSPIANAPSRPEQTSDPRVQPGNCNATGCQSTPTGPTTPVSPN